MLQFDEKRLIVGQYIDCYLPAIDGVVLAVSNYARFLNKNHCRCYIVTAKAPRDHIENEDFPILRYGSLPLPNRPPYRFGVPSLDIKLAKVSKELRPDLIHAHSPFTAGHEALRQARARNVPVVATFHSKYYEDALQITKSEAIARQTVKLIAAYYAKVDVVWSVNKATASTLREYGYEGEIEIFENGTDFVEPESVSEARAWVENEYSIPPGTPLLLYVGQHIEQKNLPALIDSLAILQKKGVSFRFLSVGEGYALDMLKKRVKEYGLCESVTFTGKISDRELLCRVYTRADMLTFPSLYDTAGLVVREAAHAACPSLLVRGSNAADGAVDGENAILCENDPRAMAEAIEKALKDPVALKRCGEGAAKAYARTWEDIVSSVYERYERIIQNYRARHGDPRPTPKMI